jgi:flagellar biosynthetic protein FlhB
MADQGFAEKTEKPTPKKRQDTRKKGEVAKSRELPSVAVLLAGMSALAISGTYMSSRMRIHMENIFTRIALNDFNAVDAMALGREVVGSFFPDPGPFFWGCFPGCHLFERRPGRLHGDRRIH